MYIKNRVVFIVLMLLAFCFSGNVEARFLSADPVRVVNPATGKINQTILTNPQRLNLYTYGLNNPYRYVDPDGEIPIPIIFAIAAGAWGLDAVAPKSTDVPNSKGFLDHADNATMAAGIGGIRNVGKVPLWTSTKFKSAAQNALGHFKKHGHEFSDIQNAKQYVDRATSFLNKPPKGSLSHTRRNGDILRYNQKSNTFGVMRADGAPRTMFKPTDGIKYWSKQTKEAR